MNEVDRSTHGYYANDITWREAMSDWLDRHHGYKPDPDWITPTSGIVSALGLILQAFTEEDDASLFFHPPIMPSAKSSTPITGTSIISP